MKRMTSKEWQAREDLDRNHAFAKKFGIDMDTYDGGVEKAAKGSVHAREELLNHVRTIVDQQPFSYPGMTVEFRNGYLAAHADIVAYMEGVVRSANEDDKRSVRRAEP